ncbi:hypothetical protein ACIPX0_26570 [Streptomyces sp. NPDC090075]|uniref:hypothetical protein n=1 Tax=Streptomyces sp. NPDC090075 TaxID=3365937 RepID=UPI0037F11770
MTTETQGWFARPVPLAQSPQAMTQGADIDAIKAGSIAFKDDETMTLRIAEPDPEPSPPSPASFVDEIHGLKNEVDLCRAGHCESAYKAGADVERLTAEVERLAQENADLRAGQPKTVAALREALVALGEDA